MHSSQKKREKKHRWAFLWYYDVRWGERVKCAGTNSTNTCHCKYCPNGTIARRVLCVCVCAKVFIKCQKIEHQHNLRIVQHEKQKRENTIKSSYTQIKHTGNVFLFFSLFWLQKCQKICLFHKKKITIRFIIIVRIVPVHCSRCEIILNVLTIWWQKEKTVHIFMITIHRTRWNQRWWQNEILSHNHAD